MGVLRGWLLTLVAVSILCALAQSLMPDGPVRQVGRLACGMVLLCCILWPGTGLDRSWLTEWEFLTGVEEARLEGWVTDRRKELIEERCAAYIQNTARENGISCTLRVACSPEGELFLPREAWVMGELTEEEWSWLCARLREQLGVERVHREERKI